MKTHRAMLFAVATVTLGCASSPAPQAAAAAPAMAGMQHADARQVIAVPAIRRDMILMEMRGLLTSVNGVLRGLAANDREMMRSSAASAGMETMRAQMQERMGQMGQMMQGRGHGQDPVLGGMAMPDAFMQLGMATHHGMDSLATSIAGGATSDQIVAQLARVTNNCVSCHQAYRLDVR